MFVFQTTGSSERNGRSYRCDVTRVGSLLLPISLILGSKNVPAIDPAAWSIAGAPRAAARLLRVPQLGMLRKARFVEAMDDEATGGAAGKGQSCSTGKPTNSAPTSGPTRSEVG
jgi:hypothetical protein